MGVEMKHIAVILHSYAVYTLIFFHCCWCVDIVLLCQSSTEGRRRECSQAEEEGQGCGHVCRQVGAGGREGNQRHCPTTTLRHCQGYHLHPPGQVDTPLPPPSPFFPSLYVLPQYVIPLPLSVPLVNIHTHPLAL